MNPKSVVLSLLFPLACTHTSQAPTEVESLLQSDSCEQAATAILSKHDPNVTTSDENLTLAGRTAASGVVTAAGYTADAVINVPVGTVSVVVMCPLLVLAVIGCAATSCPGAGSGSLPGCIADPFGHPFYTHLGSKVLDGTESWREDPAAKELAEAMRGVATCYRTRDDLPNVIKASQQLTQIREARLFDRLPKAEQKVIDGDIAAVNKRLDELDINYRIQLPIARLAAVKTLVQGPDVTWRDLDTGMTWHYQSAKLFAPSDAAMLCRGAELRVPTRGELKRALEHGLADPAKNEAYASSGALQGTAFVSEGAGNYYASVQFATASVEGASESTSYSLLCVD